MGSQPVARTPAKKLAPEADLREQWAAITAMGVRTEPARSATINAPLRCPPILMRRTRTQSAGEETHG
ncbi:hypothetical protein CN128_28775 [Sinorhizobium meliloti]|nr:hypothetical protein CDO31_19425 [Sinorhizobium meliloti]ASQ01804.1 hypothetical protein CDO24_31240 [Sinorhizobium meliloti]PTD30001.1 hypothetical protein C5N13_05350 [Sinorhizobium meliloti]RVG04604.1 hypothetical protein CN234_27440 [Sinorhizobium meliloti]RVG44021.1 hypothetical protein CN226_32020 [Sinorhizobium meliloti]